MSIITRVISNALNFTKHMNNKMLMPSSNNSITSEITQDLKPGGLFQMATRTKIRNNFPRPSEVKRIRVHGWVTRMSTRSGRRVLMNRILKGRWVYSH